MLNIDELKARSGMPSLSSESWGGGVTGEFKNTYDKIMKSKYSANTHLLAAESLINEVVVDEFTDSVVVANLAQEAKILKIIDPLANSASSEANNIYYKICEVLGSEGKETISDKVSGVGSRIWNAIKEAFRKLRLAITNVIAGIRKAVTSGMAGNFDEEYRKYDEIIRNCTGNNSIGNKTIKTTAYSKTELFAPEFQGNMLGKVEAFMKNFSSIVNEMKEEAKKVMNESRPYATKESFKDKYELKLRNALKTINKKLEGSWVKENGNLAKLALYGRTGKGTLKFKDIFKTSTYKEILSNNFPNSLNSTLSQYDMILRNLNDTIKIVENYSSNWKSTNGGGANDSENATSKRRTLEQLQAMRTIVSKLTPFSKDLYVELIRARVKIGNAARSALKGTNVAEKDYQKETKKMRKETRDKYKS